MSTAEPKYFKQILFIYVLFVVTVLVHFPVLLNGIINWRDDELFLSLHALSGSILSVTQQDAYSPAMMLWYRLWFFIGGDGYFIYHAVSVLLHTLNAVLIFLTLLRFRMSAVVSGALALLFALHPIHVETVSMVSGQPTLLTLLFLLLFIRAYHRFLEAGKGGPFFASLLWAALFYSIGHPSLLPLIAAGMLHWSAGRRMPFRTILPLLVMWGVTFASGLFHASLFDRVWPMISGSVLMVRYGIVEQAVRLFTPWQADLLVPTATSVLPLVQGQYLFPFAVLTALAGAVAVRRRQPLLFISAVIIAASSLPLTSGILRGEWLLSDDGSYIPMIGWSLALAGLAEFLFRSIPFPPKLRTALWSIGIVVLLPLAGMTVIKSTYWESGEKYWSQALTEQPANIFALVKKGMYHYFRFEIAPSLQALDQAVLLAPNDYEVIYSRGVVHLGAMNLPQATRDYSEALRLDSASSNAYYGLGSIHALYSRYDSAVIMYSRAIRFSTNFFEAYTERAVAFGALKRYSEAMADFRKAEAIAPAYSKIYGDRGVLLLQMGNAQEAAADFLRQTEVEPRSIAARMNAAMTAVMLGDTLTASLQFSKAMEIDSLRTNLYLMAAGKTILRTPEEKALGEYIFRRSTFGKF